MLKTWVIFCPGPSLKGLKLKDIGKHEQSQAIAVNGAVLRRFPARYWAMIDSDAFRSTLRAATGKKIVDLAKRHLLWIPDNWISHFEKWDPDYYGFFRLFTKHTWSVSSLSNIMPFARHIKWDKCSMFAAIALAILNKAERIEIYGADMNGWGYFKKGLENYKTRHQIERWREEKKDFKIIVDSAKKCGINITRIRIRNKQ